MPREPAHIPHSHLKCTLMDFLSLESQSWGQGPLYSVMPLWCSLQQLSPQERDHQLSSAFCQCPDWLEGQLPPARSSEPMLKSTTPSRVLQLPVTWLSCLHPCSLSAFYTVGKEILWKHYKFHVIVALKNSFSHLIRIKLWFLEMDGLTNLTHPYLPLILALWPCLQHVPDSTDCSVHADSRIFLKCFPVLGFYTFVLAVLFTPNTLLTQGLQISFISWLKGTSSKQHSLPSPSPD